MIKTKKIPLRKCLGCNEMFPKKQLIRVVKNNLGEIDIDFKGKAHGRGAYICNEKTCFEKAYKSKAFNRAFQCEVPKDVYERLSKEFENIE